MAPEDEDPEVVRDYACASLGAIDRFFLGVRYALNTLDRSRVSGRQTRKGHDGVRADRWDVYHLYNPAYAQALLDLQRWQWNWARSDTHDGQTPAMRLGLVDRPVDLTEMLEAAGEDLSALRQVEDLLEAQREAVQARRGSSRPTPASAGLELSM